MNREIKFRIWWENPFADEPEYKMFYEGGDDEIDCMPYHIGPFGCFDDEDLTFMQYTGLKDKNGVEIYDGDIVCRAETWRYAVEWKRNGFYLIHEPDDGLWGDVPVVELEVIGNIHESPELLK